MAQNYEIDIKRFNGQDYDTLLPTPASHASTHQADGADPITLRAGNYGDTSIPTSAYQDSSVTRAKLAQDALYSPIVAVSSTTYNITNTDIGKTLRTAGSVDVALTLTQAASTVMPVGSEIAVLRWTSKDCTISLNGVLAAYNEVTSVVAGKTFRPANKYDMIALKKILASSSGDTWLVTGNVEVVE